LILSSPTPSRTSTTTSPCPTTSTPDLSAGRRPPLPAPIHASRRPFGTPDAFSRTRFSGLRPPPS
jgi:hypothetical protein